MLGLGFFLGSPYAEVCLSLFFFLFRIQEIYPHSKKTHFNLTADAYSSAVYVLGQLGDNQTCVVPLTRELIHSF